MSVSAWIVWGLVGFAAPGPLATKGEVRLGPGLVASYDYHFDRNALADSRRVGDALIALTASGNLLRFDLATVAPTRQKFGPVAASCLGSGEGGATLVGFEDGRVCRVDPTTLDLTDVARLPHKPIWLGALGAGLVAVVEEDDTFEAGGRRYPKRSSTVHDLGTGKVYPIGNRASAFLLDRAGRLWLGADKGEWGGWCTAVDLARGEVRAVAGIKEHPDEAGEGWPGVYGFVELRDGRVWAHGGTMHMGSTDAFIRRVDGPKAEVIYKADNRGEIRERMEGREPKEPDRPALPITRIIEERDGGLLVFAYNRNFRVNPTLTRWERAGSLTLRYRSGRPDAVGVFPSVVAAHRLDGPGRRLLIATALDGYVGLDGEKTTPHALPGQLQVDYVHRIEVTTEGTFLVSWDDRSPTWTLGPDGWKVADLAPPFAPAPGDNEPDMGWSNIRILGGPGGVPYLVCGSGWAGTRTTARRVGGKAEVLGVETSDLVTNASFITPDGTLWNAWRGSLKRFEAGRWVEVASLPESLKTGLTLRAVGGAGPPWAVLDRFNRRLLRLTTGKPPTLGPIPLTEEGQALAVDDAIPWRAGEALLATARGLRLLDLASGKLGPSPLPMPERPPTSLCRDGLGRVWLGGEGLWMADPAGGPLVALDALPILGARTKVGPIAGDPGHPDGVVVSLSARGVVFLKIPSKP